jgi:hypothetical protein
MLMHTFDIFCTEIDSYEKLICYLEAEVSDHINIVRNNGQVEYGKIIYNVW